MRSAQALCNFQMREPKITRCWKTKKLEFQYKQIMKSIENEFSQMFSLKEHFLLVVISIWVKIEKKTTY